MPFLNFTTGYLKITMIQRQHILILFTFFIANVMLAQQSLLPRQSNAELKNFIATHPNLDKSYHGKNILAKTNAAFDSLPFFEDFTTSKVVTDTNKWIDYNVFINNGFPVNPPSYNVATFDGLDKIGNAYQLQFNGAGYGPADTLTSVPLNLTGYTVADNIYFSFFYEMGGFGDPPQTQDSLLLQFLTFGGKWNTIWVKAGGGKSESQFSQVILPVNNSIYLHGAFQFRFVNYASYSGNWNIWNIDYIRMDRNRSDTDTLYTDVTIMTSPTPLLKRYYNMPWNQYFKNYTTENADSTSFQVRNLKNSSVQVSSKNFVFNKEFNNLITNSSFTLGLLTYQLPQKIYYAFNVGNTRIDTIVPKNDSVIVKSIYTASENSDVRRQNDSFYKEQLFSNYYAYDDGTAENGFGIINGPGKLALGYETNVDDTLRAVDFYFNQSSTSNAGINFTLTIWSAISPVGQTANQDKRIHFQTVMVPDHTYSYRDKMGGFVRFYLDTPRFIAAGKFYVGWVQNSNYQLNVGYDMNYPGNFGKPYNPNVYVNTLGSWFISGTVPGFAGSPMIRAVMGKEAKITGIHAPVKNEIRKLNVYPNPVHTLLYVDLPEKETNQIRIINMQGQVVKELPMQDRVIDVQDLTKGIYILNIFDPVLNQSYTSKFVIE